jgi:hypothetical protein
MPRLYINRRLAMEHRDNPSLEPSCKNALFTQVGATGHWGRGTRARQPRYMGWFFNCVVHDLEHRGLVILCVDERFMLML